MFAHLIDCNDYGGTDAASLKLGIDSIFDEDGPLPCAAFREKLISCTADGANVNMGHKEGLHKKLCRDGDRPWFVPIHCISHLVELAVKDAFFESSFKDVDRLYENIFSPCKSLGVVKSEITKAAEVLNISYYAFPKLKGTRFIPHSRTSISSLINMWPDVIMALENNMSSKKGKKETKNKIKGILKQLKSYRVLCKACVFLDILKKVSPLSKVFEDDGLLAFDVKPLLDRTLMELGDLLESAGKPDELLDSYLARFKIDAIEPNNLISYFYKYGHMLKLPTNREQIVVI